MKFTFSWLKDHLDTQATLSEIVEKLTAIGLEVEHVEDKAAILAPFIIAHVISAEKHPNADRLRVCMVDVGNEKPVQVVCGAPNVRAGMKGVFSPAGTYIPSKKITLTVGVIRGVESTGMLCSEAELELSDDHDGIIELPDDAPVGQRYVDYAGLGDPVIEINLTPNRSDCTSIYGIARDLAAAGLGTLKVQTPQTINAKIPCPVSVTLDFIEEDKKLCPAFGLRLIRGIKNNSSPEWMQRRLQAIGLRPINLLVDITNYMTFDQGRPLHVFDAAKIHGNLVVRRARKGEKLVALNGREYECDESNVIIADDRGVESIGGIIGAETSGCDETTTDVLVESALWDPLNIARTGRRLGIVSDARYRFERGVDPAYCIPGLEKATQLIMEYGGGEASEITLAGTLPLLEHTIFFPWKEVQRLTGVNVSKDRASQILKDLGFGVVENEDGAQVSVPSWRPDIDGKADLAEEVIRIVGLDAVAATPWARLTSGIPKPVLTLLQKRTRLAKRTLASRGMLEAVTYSFISHEDALLFGGGQKELILSNPIASNMSDMRPSLLPGLIRGIQKNIDRGMNDLALFEVGQCFASDLPEGQTIRAGGIRRGLSRAAAQGRDWQQSNKNADTFDAKADALALLTSLGIPTGGLQIIAGGPEWVHPGRSAKLCFGPKNCVGYFGELHPALLKKMDIKSSMVVFEITLDALPPVKVKPTKTKPKLILSELQSVSRDFAFVVKRSVEVSQIIKSIRNAEKQFITDVTIFDLYEGEHVTSDEKSVACAVTLQPIEKTFTDVEIEAISQKIIAEVQSKTGAVLRG